MCLQVSKLIFFHGIKKSIWNFSQMKQINIIFDYFQQMRMWRLEKDKHFDKLSF